MSLVRSQSVALVLLIAILLAPASAAEIQLNPANLPPTPSMGVSLEEIPLNPALVPPTPPMNVAWTEDNGQVTVTWDPPLFFGGADNVTYRVYKDSALVADGLITTTYIETVGTGPSASASYSVTAVNDAGESAHMGPCIDTVGPAVDPWNCIVLVIDIVFWVIDEIPIP